MMVFIRGCISSVRAKAWTPEPNYAPGFYKGANNSQELEAHGFLIRFTQTGNPGNLCLCSVSMAKTSTDNIYTLSTRRGTRANITEQISLP